MTHAASARADLSPAHRELQERARNYVDDVLIPLEEKAERAGGPLPDDDVQRIRETALETRLAGGLHSPDHGGQGWSTTEWLLVEEQFGRNTNGISWYMPTAYNVWKSASPQLIDRWLRPALKGELHDAYAVTEAEA
ncbi:MAG TPA: acyl-CoA dehydrogenase family protein, partial [Actinomycetes bacterium]|nr:acyl-CoA dehydrogenase family protein [Actinomycetes bacterium]